eukprot:TRINITY_DN12558_c13_g1_i2.p2 TRINITY_DN12558_c13_g1~~TRINITY_DN12558_c13_g1_i2.p2  ORF type:complete len:183 (+),score=17.36 TRINITY_DN12558_c13_g1_i2:236-784(+)
MLLYGGLIPSRCSNTSAAEISRRMQRMTDLQTTYPNISTYRPRSCASQVITKTLKNHGFGRCMAWIYTNILSVYPVIGILATRAICNKSTLTLLVFLIMCFNIGFGGGMGTTNATVALLQHHLKRPFEALYTTLDDSGDCGINVDEAQHLITLINAGHDDNRTLVYPGADELSPTVSHTSSF